MRIMRFLSLIIVLAVILSMSVFAAEPVILAQPQDYFFPAGTTFPALAYFSVMAEGENLSYQWQYKLREADWANSSSSTSPNLVTQIPLNLANGGVKYRCIITSSDGSVISNVTSVSVGGYLMDSIPQMLSWGTTIINSIFDWIGYACASIIDIPLLLIGVSLFALGASIAILSRLLSRS